jgi:hypothetical protein
VFDVVPPVLWFLLFDVVPPVLWFLLFDVVPPAPDMQGWYVEQPGTAVHAVAVTPARFAAAVSLLFWSRFWSATS